MKKFKHYTIGKLHEKFESAIVRDIVRVRNIYRKTGYTVPYKWWMNTVCRIEFALRRWL